MFKKGIVYGIILIILILFFGFIPKLKNKNKFKLKILTNGIINKFIILVIISIVAMEDMTIGLVLLILFLSILNMNISKDGFLDYFTK
jgi:CRISPR/Cas system CMR-associated protein Cmr3 (group 5 of RAMP superfamily)